MQAVELNRETSGSSLSVAIVKLEEMLDAKLSQSRQDNYQEWALFWLCRSFDSTVGDKDRELYLTMVEHNLRSMSRIKLGVTQ